MKQENILTRLMNYMGYYKLTLILSIIFATISAILSLSAYVSVYNVAKEVVKSAGDLSALNGELLISYGWKAVSFMAAAFGIYGIALLFSHITAFHTVAKIRIKLMLHIGDLSLGYHSSNPSGKLRKIVEKNTDNLENIIAHQIPDTVQAIVMPVAFLGFMFVFDWRLSLACLVPIIIGFSILASMLKGSSQDFVAKYQKSAEDMSNAAVEYVRGISVVKVFGQTAHSFKRYSDSIKEFNEFLTKYALSMENADSGYHTAINSIFFALIPTGIVLFNYSNDPEQVILSFIFFAVIIPSVVTILMRIMGCTSQMMIAETSLSKIEEILNEHPLAVIEKTNPATSFDIEFKNVSFSYEETAPRVLHNLSITAKQGEVTALVGPSGGGKSTVINLIARFWDVQGGSVSIGGVDVKNMDYDQWMQNVSIVFQDTNLFKLSIAENVAFSKPNATQEEIINALHLAQCDDIIEKLPNGIHTIIGTKGVYLSGGEMQRVALARAILKDAPIILFDEATSFADAENEFLIQKALDTLLRDKTVIMIAHRLSTVVNADKICVIDSGDITEQGTHGKLLENNGIYAHMFREYQDSVSWKIGGNTYA